MTIENLADTRTLAREFGEVASGRLDRGVPEPGLDLLDRHALVGERRGVVATQRVRMREAVGHTSDRGVAAQKLRKTLLGDRSGGVISRARDGLPAWSRIRGRRRYETTWPRSRIASLKLRTRRQATPTTCHGHHRY